MKAHKKLILLAAWALFCALFAGCSSKPAVSFMDLKLGAARAEVVAQLGENYEEIGNDPKHLIYENLQLFDFVKKGATTETSVFLNSSEEAYSYSHYIYTNLDNNEKNLKSFFQEKYGDPTTNDAGGSDWKDGDLTYSLYRGSDYIVISVF